jgi:hypothetical protein
VTVVIQAESINQVVIRKGSEAVATSSDHDERCSVCDRPIYEPDGKRHPCFYFLE